MKNKVKFIVFGTIIILLLIIIFFYKNYYKKIEMGNNITNKSLDENYILDINSFTATIELTVQSNKNTNKYLIKQEVKEGKYKQEVVEPENIKGIETLYENGKLTIYNSKLNLNKIYAYYPYITDNIIFLTDFIEKYKIAKKERKSNIQETEDNIILIIKNDNKVEELYVKKSNGEPYKIVVQDNSKKDIVYILYKEINLENV